MLLKEFCSHNKFDQSQTFLQKLWPILTAPSETSIKPAYFLRSLDQFLPVLTGLTNPDCFFRKFDHLCNKFKPISTAFSESLTNSTNSHSVCIMQPTPSENLTSICFPQKFSATPLWQEIWPILPTPEAHLTNSDDIFRRSDQASCAPKESEVCMKFGQSCIFLKKMWPV